MRMYKALSSVQVDPKSFQRTASIHVHNVTKRVYRSSAHTAQCGNHGTLVDRGANGGIIGDDAHILCTCWMKEIYLFVETDQFIINHGSVVVATVATACSGS